MDETFFNAGEFWDSKGAGKWNRPMGSAGEFETAGDHVQNSIDLNEQLIKNRPATFFMRVNSNAMSGAGIHKGDVVIVDRSLVAKNGKVVIAVVDGELLIRRLEISDGKKTPAFSWCPAFAHPCGRIQMLVLGGSHFCNP